MQKGNSNSWIELAFKTATRFGRGVYVAFREGEAEVWEPAKKTHDVESAGWWEVLDLPRSASRAEIRSAYRRLMQKHHPDKVAHLSEAMQKEAEKAAKRLNDVYERAMSRS
jgi:DnaJ-domain-containing protein 1